MAKAPKVKAAKVVDLKSAEIQTLKVIAEFGSEGTFAPDYVFAELEVQGYVESNKGVKNDEGHLAVRVTAKGQDYLTAMKVKPQVPASVFPTPAEKVEEESHFPHAHEEPAILNQASTVQSVGIKLDDNVPVPPITGRGRKTSPLPFDEMAVGQSFFMPNTEAMPNAARAMGSKASIMNRKYMLEGDIATRNYIARSVVENGIEGARVWRTA